MDIDEMVLEAAGDQVETQPLDDDMEHEQGEGEEQTQETLETLAETPLSALPRDRVDRERVERGERIERGARGEMGGERQREGERQHQYPIVYSGSAAGMNTAGGGGGSGAGGGGGLGVKTRGVFTGGREGASSVPFSYRVFGLVRVEIGTGLVFGGSGHRVMCGFTRIGVHVEFLSFWFDS